MRMYLSSFRLGDHPERLVDMIDWPARVAVIANACDVYPEPGRAEGVQREIAALTSLGLDPHELDLRNYLDSARGLAGDLSPYQAVWVRGGNTFILRYLYARTGLDRLLKALLARDEIVYAGYSAGIVLLPPSLRGLEIVDRPEVVTAVYGVEPIWEGLDLLDKWIVPHYDSPGHPETEACGRLAQHYHAHGIPHWTLHDGQALVVEGGTPAVV